MPQPHQHPLQKTTLMLCHSVPATAIDPACKIANSACHSIPPEANVPNEGWKASAFTGYTVSLPVSLFLWHLKA